MSVVYCISSELNTVLFGQVSVQQVQFRPMGFEFKKVSDIHTGLKRDHENIELYPTENLIYIHLI